MRRSIRFCQPCQIDLETAEQNAHLLEENCAEHACPFAERLDALRRKLDRQTLEVDVSPQPVLEGSPFTVAWSYKGDAFHLERISLTGRGKVQPEGRAGLTATRDLVAVEFDLVFRDGKRVAIKHPVEVNPLPRIGLATASPVVLRGSSLAIRAWLDSVSEALIEDERGDPHDFTGGRFVTPPLDHSRDYLIRAWGRHGGYVERRLAVKVIDHPTVEHLSPEKGRMTVGSARLRFRARHTLGCLLTMTCEAGSERKMELGVVDIARGEVALQLPPGKWTASMIAKGEGAEARSETVGFTVIDTLPTRIGRFLGALLLTCLACAAAGGLIHLAWPLIGFAWRIVESIFLSAWLILKLLFTAVVFIASNPWLFLVGLFLWFLHEIG